MVRVEAIGWAYAHAHACVELDEGRDPRDFEVPLLIELSEKDLSSDGIDLPVESYAKGKGHSQDF